MAGKTASRPPAKKAAKNTDDDDFDDGGADATPEPEPEKKSSRRTFAEMERRIQGQIESKEKELEKVRKIILTQTRVKEALEVSIDDLRALLEEE